MDAHLIARMLEQTARAMYDDRGPRSVHPGQWAVMRYLAIAGRQARTVGGVAAFLGVTHAPASRAVAALARRGFVRVETDEQDRRVRRIELTQQGSAALARDPVHRLAEIIESLDSRRRAALAETLKIIYARLAGGAGKLE